MERGNVIGHRSYAATLIGEVRAAGGTISCEGDRIKLSAAAS